MNDKILTLIKRKNWLYQTQRKSGNLDYATLNAITTDISNANKCFTKKLSDPRTTTKTYWLILKTFVNCPKISLAPPLLVGSQLVTDFLVRANLLQNFLVNNAPQWSTAALLLEI